MRQRQQTDSDIVSTYAHVKLQPEQVGEAGAGACWACGATQTGARNCEQCARLQPLGANADYFAALGLERRLTLDAADLETRFHERSRLSHPDFYRNGLPRERLIALENSATINRAYRTLRDPLTRAQYLLELERGKRDEAVAQPPQALFMAILEIQELLQEFDSADAAARPALLTDLRARHAEMRALQDERQQRLIDELFPRWDALAPDDASGREAVLDAIATVIGERGYLRRVLDGFDRALASTEA